MSAKPTPKRPRGRPALAGGKAGKRFMIHLPQSTATMLRAAGNGSLSLGVIRLADIHRGMPVTVGPPPRSVKQVKATQRARRRVQAALEVVNQVLQDQEQVEKANS
jgi:hypothetical protein